MLDPKSKFNRVEKKQKQTETKHGVKKSFTEKKLLVEVNDYGFFSIWQFETVIYHFHWTLTSSILTWVPHSIFNRANVVQFMDEINEGIWELSIGYFSSSCQIKWMWWASAYQFRNFDKYFQRFLDSLTHIQHVTMCVHVAFTRNFSVKRCV